MHKVWVPGPPAGDQRPRFIKATGRTFTADKPARWMQGACLILENYRVKESLKTAVYPLELRVTAVLKRPARLERKKDHEGRIFAATFGKKPKGCKPDFDNILKLVSDTLVRASIIADDTLIFRSEITKLYAEKGSGESGTGTLILWTEVRNKEEAVPWPNDDG